MLSKTTSQSAPGGEQRATLTTLPVDFETICLHEAAHAVMRWVRGERSTMIEVNENGGFCGGTGRRISAENALLITLAGFAAETGYGLARPVFETSQAQDIDEARAILREYPHLRYFLADLGPDGTPSFSDGDRLLEKWFYRACEQLCPYSHVVEHLGFRLEQHRTLSARSVAATIRQALKES